MSVPIPPTEKEEARLILIISHIAIGIIVAIIIWWFSK